MNLLSIIAAVPLVGLVLAQNSAENNSYLSSTRFQRHVVNATQAGAIIQAAALESANISLPVNIAVTDPAGLLVGFLRTDNAYPGSIDIAQKKARAVSLFNGAFPSIGLHNNSQPGASLYGIEETNGGLIVFGGGVPIFADGFFIGPVGVSDGSVDQDIQIATAGAEAVGSTS